MTEPADSSQKNLAEAWNPSPRTAARMPGWRFLEPVQNGAGAPADDQAVSQPDADRLDDPVQAFRIDSQRSAAEPDAHAVASDKAAPRPTFPHPGDRLAGFLIVSELGRGAFARVYLAEQAELASRQVAIKVAPALGDEPQMLARLQHTHIVPIHSVHDDGATGLRLICMPYLGGANLAQVLHSAAGRLPSQTTGRSLVDALDRVGNKLSLAQYPSKVRSASGRAGWLDRPAADRRYGAAATRDIGPPSVVRSIWGRYWARLPWWTRFGPVDQNLSDELASAIDLEAEHAQPARRFLRKATYIQAAVWIVARLAEALEHAHSRGLLHRDLKPSNILIAADGTPMLLDFNLSAEAAGPSAADRDKAMIGGTLPYMAPEHLDAFNPLGHTPPEAVDERSDLYALGLILFEMVAGRHPFADPPAYARLSEVLNEMAAERRRGAPSLRQALPEAPWSLDSILRKCLDPEPNQRYQTASELAEDLRRFLDDLPLAHAPERSVRERVAKWARRHPRASSASSVGLVAVISLLTVGALLWGVTDHLRSASARLHRAAFQTAFDESQLLLNTTSGPPEHLATGIARAEKALDIYGVHRPGDWTRGELVARLPRKEQLELREQAAEMVLLVARAQVYRAERLGSEHDRQRALEWAVAALRTAERFDPQPSAALYDERARFLGALGLAKAAAADRNRRDLTPPRTSRDFTLLGTSALAHGDLAQAEARLLQAVAIDPRRFWAWFTLGLCHADGSRYLEAAGDFSVCTALVPRFAWPHLNRGLALARAGRLAEAKDAYDQALKLNPSFVEALVNRGFAHLELGQSSAARADFERAVALGRQDAAILAALAEAKSRLGLRSEARSDLDRLIGLHPEDAALQVARGFLDLDDPAASTSARALFEQALKIDPRNARAHLGLALLFRKSDRSAALEHAEQALESNPGLLDALELRALLRARLGNPAAALDAERLVEFPTPHRLYNAACALAILARTGPDRTLLARARNLLDRAIAAGFPPAEAQRDPDLAILREAAP